MNLVRRLPLAAAALACVAALVSGCGREPAGDAQPPAARAQAMIEEGNQAYASGDYRLAARRYAAAAVVREDDPAAYYGLGMALSKLGRDEDARKAYARAKSLTREADEADGGSGGTP